MGVKSKMSSIMTSTSSLAIMKMQATCLRMYNQRIRSCWQNRYLSLSPTTENGSGDSKSSADAEQNKTTQKFDISLLNILVCPLSKSPLRYDEAKEELICDKLNVAYAIKDGIPNFIPTDARQIKESN